MANRPPSSCTIGRSSGGITGTASSTIHSGLFSDVMNAWTTFSRLIARCCFWPFDVLIVSRRVIDSCGRSRSRSSSRIASAPMPPRKYTPKPYGEPKRSLSSRKICSSLTTCFTSSSRNSFHVSSSRRTPSTAASRASSRRLSMSATISLTLVAHCWTISRSSLRAPSTRQRSYVSSRTCSSLASASARSSTARRRPLPISRARSRFFASTEATSSASSPDSSSPPSSWSSSLWRCFVIAPFFEPDDFSSSARSGSRAARISCAAVATDSISRGARRRSSRVAVCRTSSRIRFGSSPAIDPASAGKIAPARVRASSRPGRT